MKGIDLDRPCIIRDIPGVGMDVVMYKDNPGVYYNAHGNEIGVGLAQMAQFDVEKYALLRRRKLAVEAAAKAADAEILASEKIDREVIVEEKDGYKIVALSAGRHIIKDPEGNVLTQGVVLTLEMARKVLGEVKTAMDKVAPKPEAAESPAAVGVRAGLARGAGTAPLRT